MEPQLVAAGAHSQLFCGLLAIDTVNIFSLVN